MKSPNFIPISPELLAKPGKGFAEVGPRVARRFLDARFETHTQAYGKQFRAVAPGMMLVGEERRQVFVGGVPTGVLVPPSSLTDLGPHWIASGVAWSDGLLKLNGHGLSGDPTTLADGSRIGIMVWQPPQLALEAAWAAVQWTLALGFSAEDFGVFATAPRAACLTFLREAAHHFIVKTLLMVHPRERLEVYRKAGGKLHGFSKADAASAEAAALFAEALLETITAAKAADLLALSNTLTTVEGGAASE